MADRYISVKKAALRLEKTPHYVRKLLREGKIFGKKNEIADEWAVDAISLDSFIKKQYPQSDEFLPITIHEAVADVEDLLDTDLISYISLPGAPLSEINSDDAILLDDVLYKLNPRHKGKKNKFKNLTLMIHSAGGSMDAALKISQILQYYSENYTVIVPLMAKSAATVICLYSNKILMTPIAELGPVDPLVRDPSTGHWVQVSAIKQFIEQYGDKRHSTKKTAYDEILEEKFKLLSPFVLGAYEVAKRMSDQTITKELERWIPASNPNRDLLLSEAKAEFLDKPSHGFPMTLKFLEKFQIGTSLASGASTVAVKTLMNVYIQYMNQNNFVKLWGNRDINRHIQITPQLVSDQPAAI